MFDSVAVPGRSARCDRQDDLLGARGVRFGAGKRVTSLALPLGGVQENALLGEREVFDSVPETGAVLLSEPDPGVVPLGGGRAGGASRRARCSTRCRRTGRFTWWRAWRPLRSGGGPAAGWRQRNCCPARTAGARRTASRRRRPFVSRCSSSRRSAGGTPLGGCGASIWHSASTGASVQRLGGARPQPQRRIPPSRRQPARGRARCGSGSSTSSSAAASGRSSSAGSPQGPFFVDSSST